MTDEAKKLLREVLTDTDGGKLPMSLDLHRRISEFNARPKPAAQEPVCYVDPRDIEAMGPDGAQSADLRDEPTHWNTMPLYAAPAGQEPFGWLVRTHSALSKNHPGPWRYSHGPIEPTGDERMALYAAPQDQSAAAESALREQSAEIERLTNELRAERSSVEQYKEILSQAHKRGDDNFNALERAESALREQAPSDALIAAKDAAYLERNQVVAALAKLYPSGTARTPIEGWNPEWHGCVYIDLPTGQVSWHYHDSQAYLFAHLPPYAGQWDGHDTPEKYRRLAAMTQAPSDALDAIFDISLKKPPPLPEIGLHLDEKEQIVEWAHRWIRKIQAAIVQSKEGT
jgi:hypothetical protein